jgi:hypothetical protein
VRHVRMLGLCLVAVFAVCAMAAASALAKEPKDSMSQFKNCPTSGSVEGKPARKCTNGETRPGAGGSYTVGGITVDVTKSIRLQGAYTASNSETNYTGILIPPEDGAAPISRSAETVPGEVLGHISLAEQEELGWPTALKESYAKAQARGKFKEGTTKEIIEPAGFDRDYVSEYYLVGEEDEAEGASPPIIVNVQIQGANSWLARLGGDCQIGSEAEPIVQELWTGEVESPLTHEIMKGSAGAGSFGHKAEMAQLSGVELVANHYAVPVATKCGGPSYEAYLDPAVDRAFGLPAAAGASTTRLIGELDVASAYAVGSLGF